MKKCGKKRILASAIAFVLLLTLTLALSVNAQQKKPIKIGSIFSVTGPAAFLGDDMKRTVQMYIEKQNKMGGINGHPLEWYVYDAAGDVTKGITAAKRLIEQDKVDICVGDGNSSAVAISLSPVFEKAKVPFVSVSGSKLICTPVENKQWCFKAAVADTDAVKKCIEWWKKKGVKKIALLSDTTGWGKSAKEEFEIYLKGSGIEAVAMEEFDPGATDLTPQLVKIRSANPDAIMCQTVTPAGVVYLKNIQQLGMGNKIIMHGLGFVEERYMKMAGEASEGCYVTAPVNAITDKIPNNHPYLLPLKKKILGLYEDFEKYYGKKPNTYACNAYDGVLLTFHALKEAVDGNVINKQKIRDALEKINGLVGTCKIHRFTPTDHSGDASRYIAIVQWKNGAWNWID